MATAKPIEKKLVADLKKITVYTTQEDRDALHIALRQRQGDPLSVNRLLTVLGKIYLLDKDLQKRVDSYVVAEEQGAGKPFRASDRRKKSSK